MQFKSVIPTREIRLHPDLARAEQIADVIGELSGYLNAANCRLLELIV